MIEMGLAVAVFVGIVLALVAVILLASRWLQPHGRVEIRVNETRSVSASAGERLLEALRAAGLSLPAACGGKGTCGQCRVRVLGDAPPARPTDLERIPRRGVAAGERLACQLTLRGDLAIRIPEEIFGVRHWRCRVRSARSVGTLLREIVAELPEGERLVFRAGSYVQVTAPAYAVAFRDFELDPDVRAEWECLNLTRYEVRSAAPATRAYSLANQPLEDGVVMLLVRLATPPAGSPEAVPPGIVSSYLFGLRPGDALEVAGPYGYFTASEGDAEMVFVGGGAGMAPMRSHILDQLIRLRASRPISFWYGARNRRELIYADLFERLAAEHPSFRFVPALSEPEPGDEWSGEVGFVHAVLERRYLASHPHPETCEYYLCGPPLMARATLAMLDRLGVPEDHVHLDDFEA